VVDGQGWRKVGAMANDMSSAWSYQRLPESIRILELRWLSHAVCCQPASTLLLMAARVEAHLAENETSNPLAMLSSSKLSWCENGAQLLGHRCQVNS